MIISCRTFAKIIDSFFQACLQSFGIAYLWYHIEEYFEWNSSAAHPETILYGGIFSEFSSDDDRREALRLILAIRVRRRAQPPLDVRKYVYPTANIINFEATTIMDLLDFDELEDWYLTESPFTMDFSDEELTEIVQASLEYLADETLIEGDQSHAKLGRDLGKIKSHSMANEQLIISNYYQKSQKGHSNLHKFHNL